MPLVVPQFSKRKFVQKTVRLCSDSRTPLNNLNKSLIQAIFPRTQTRAFYAHLARALCLSQASKSPALSGRASQLG